MGDRETLPINHSTGSHVVHTAGGAGSGALKGGLVGLAVWAAIPVMLAVGVGALVGGIGGALIGLALVGTPVAIAAAATAPFIGMGVGGFMGAQNGHKQVQRDRAAAHMVDAEVGAMQAQATAMQAQAVALAHTRQGPPSTVFANSVQHDGQLAALQQLQAAR